MTELIRKLASEGDLEDREYIDLLEDENREAELFESALNIKKKYYEDDIYVRGLIEISSFCRNDCFYCGIRRSNRKAERYRLSRDEILECCDCGYENGFRTFVLQGGEDLFFTDKLICDIVCTIKERHDDCAVTLSLGEKTKESYKAYFDAGADRYLLRHETADEEHYRKLHPYDMSFENRRKCLWDLKDIGYQVGAGFMVGSPYQSMENIVEDIRFMQRLDPDMIGIWPFLSHKDTPFAGFKNGDYRLCLRVVAVVRHVFADALIPATTALGTADPGGRIAGLKAGANVIMPNLSPVYARSKYELYDNKLHSGEEAAEAVMKLKESVESAGMTIKEERGDRKKR